MKCEPPRSPLGDVIVSDLYLFTAFADTFKREKKSHPEQASEFKTNGSQRDFWEPEYKHRRVHTSACAQMYQRTHMHAHNQVYTSGNK